MKCSYHISWGFLDYGAKVQNEIGVLSSQVEIGKQVIESPEILRQEIISFDSQADAVAIHRCNTAYGSLKGCIAVRPSHGHKRTPAFPSHCEEVRDDVVAVWESTITRWNMLKVNHRLAASPSLFDTSDHLREMSLKAFLESLLLKVPGDTRNLQQRRERIFRCIV